MWLNLFTLNFASFCFAVYLLITNAMDSSYYVFMNAFGCAFGHSGIQVSLRNLKRAKNAKK